MLTGRAQLAQEWHKEKNGKLKPEDVTKNSNKKVWWQCKKGHEWEALMLLTLKATCLNPSVFGIGILSLQLLYKEYSLLKI
ncbi:MAG: zinc-ribbon domain-containing protein [Francisellaceae bacterium]|nr:zinc-ribbon domain-containing protein [Francisellaceae bacterium]MBT6538408.1 zinc-ribbon domain-containing protein [Francisellaceae bacterium]